ncbi:MAG: hypothetical protein GY851_05880 [bacterium]|nr:hypothetical protein [bacterium]
MPKRHATDQRREGPGFTAGWPRNAVATALVLCVALGVTVAPSDAGILPDVPVMTVVELPIAERAEVDRLTAAGYLVAHVRDDQVTLYVTDAQLAALRRDGYIPTVVARQPSGPFVPKRFSKALGVYHDYASMTAMLQDYATAYGAGQSENADICRLVSIGQSVEGRELWALVISDNPDVEEDEPEFKYVSTMHGDEPLGLEMCLYLVDRLLTDYGTDQRITDLVDETHIWIVPLMNPDGHAIQWRLNAQNQDLNRTFPSYPSAYTGNMFDGEPLHADGRPPEVARVMEWTADNSFVLSANLHTGALVVNYPYDEDGVGSGLDAPSPDDLLFEDVSLRYSVHNTPMWNNPAFTDGITNGSRWYAMYGGMQDWNYRYASCNEVTLELSNTKTPSESLLPQYWTENEESMLSYMEAVHIGVRGVVTNASTSVPVWAKVSVAGNAHPVFTDADVGDYYRMLLPGTYTLMVSAPGYIPVTLTDVVVVAGAATRVDVALTPSPYDADVNNDGAVNSLDVQLVVNAALGHTVAYDCDIDGNGAVDALDVQYVLNAELFS